MLSTARAAALTKKQAYEMKEIYVFCPEEEVESVRASVRELDINFIFNELNIESVKGKVICHYKSSELPENQREFLVLATEIGAWVEPLVSYLDCRLGYTSIELLHSGYFLHQRAFSILSDKMQAMRKRIMDLLMATAIGLFALPIMLLTALAIKLESKGPVIYRQKRVGQFNKEYYVVKFRSMRTDAEKDGAAWARENDDRVTRVGRFIRKTRIDELPQLINVFRGEMSIVGPRPERDVFIQELEKHIPYYRFRHAVKPGITGLAQVKYPYGASIEDAKWKHRFDIHYIKHHRTLLDLKVILMTVKVVIFGMGR
ncbi:exopolysaccharide biosynthesis polyprenyl glycosylphosphotransferase [Gallaecimonas kandeliae]|nr:exopolysaccharide biosynthesis polyprenyl glycosylphosphotransferase [Gallaecimonas kandeliae]WKE67449.1 exopolysaccharide biosynthesis polyprenyl glycosylphosphotransferase [Gallaecimonas kandeliae]